MSVIRLSRCHQLNQAAQEAALERLGSHLGEALGASVEREARLGLMMRPLKGVITKEIEAGLAQYLDE
jgi:hypothetical protein